VILPFVPATGAATTLTVTVALALVHGAVPATVYVYTPGCEVPGVNVPDVAPPGPLQVPVASGVPPNRAKRENGAPLLHTVVDPLAPAFGAVTMETETTAVALAQGAVPGTVYV
jgi:hypothetical protein